MCEIESGTDRMEAMVLSDEAHLSGGAASAGLDVAKGPLSKERVARFGKRHVLGGKVVYTVCLAKDSICCSTCVWGSVAKDLSIASVL